MIAAGWRVGTTGTPLPCAISVAEPHTAIVGENQGTIMNLVDARAKPVQTALLDIARENPDTTLKAGTLPAPAGPS